MLGTRAPSVLEQAYLDTGAQLARMVTTGLFPTPGETNLAMNPRVGDGFIKVIGKQAAKGNEVKVMTSIRISGPITFTPAA